MESRSERTDIIKVNLPNDKNIKFEVRLVGGEEKVSSKKILSFEDVTDAIEGIGMAIAKSLEQIRPSKASVKVGLEVAMESGQLTALVVKGSGKANLEITFEWQKQDLPIPQQISDTTNVIVKKTT